MIVSAILATYAIALAMHVHGKDIEEPSIWSDGSFAETLGPEDMRKKMCTFHMKHDEEMNFNCSKCKTKISAHNKDWHNGMCDNCFNKNFPTED